MMMAGVLTILFGGPHLRPRPSWAIGDEHVVISGDAALTSENGVSSGTGTASDPYVIAGLELDFSSSPCIRIENTSSHVVIRDAVVWYWQPPGTGDVRMTALGLKMRNVTNLTLANVTVRWCDMTVEDSSRIELTEVNLTYGCGLRLLNCSQSSISESAVEVLTLENCSACDVRDNVFNYGGRISLRGCEDCVVEGNVAPRFSLGIALEGACTGCSLSSNVLLGGWGLYLDGAEDCTLRGNVIENGTENGIWCESARNLTIEANSISNCTQHGITLWDDVAESTVVGNDVVGCYGGISLYGAYGCLVYHNNLVDNLNQQALDFNGLENAWDAGYPVGGNYFSNYTGEDMFGGPGQNVTGPDGIGDDPVPIYTYLPSGTAVDRYPLMVPF